MPVEISLTALAMLRELVLMSSTIVLSFSMVPFIDAESEAYSPL